MLFWLKKTIAYWLMPLPLGLGLIVAGFWLLRKERRARLGRGLVAAGILLLVVLSNKQVGLVLLRPLESQYPAIPDVPAGGALPAPLAGCRAIVVLGGGHADTPGLAASQKLSSSALARLTEAVRLARLLPEATLYLSGPAEGAGETHAAVLARAAVSLGIAPARMVLIDTARDTDDEVQELKRRLGPTVPLALVTSAWHMPRAMGLMRRAGMNAVPCPTDYLTKPNPDFRFTDWTCDLSGLERSTWAVYERLGTLWARLQGKI
ncbi:MAG: YdcF family protein [Verrucomicrobia bacterium]|nr:YdcF family protein [Verrucomicrobiota bacterium]